MKSKLISFLAVVVLLTACKNKEEEVPKTETASAPVENKFVITLDAKVLKDDAFHIFYTEDGTQNFSEEKSVWVELKGNNNPQRIKFELPEDVYPTQLRIDLGTNKEQDNIEYGKLNFSYKGASKDLNWNDLFTYFRPNTEVTGFETNIIKPIKKEPYFGPSFYPMDALKPMLENLGSKAK